MGEPADNNASVELPASWPGRFAHGPGNKRDRARFHGLSEADQDWTDERARHLYDGTRTVARCWVQALDECLDPEIVG